MDGMYASMYAEDMDAASACYREKTPSACIIMLGRRRTSACVKLVSLCSCLSQVSNSKPHSLTARQQNPGLAQESCERLG